MRLIRVSDERELAERGADLIAQELESTPHSLLAVPTGRTPLGLYAELARRVSRGSLSLAQARIVNLDEYRGLPPGDPHSYAAFLEQHLIAPLGLSASQVRLWRGDAADPLAEARDLESRISAWGGIGLGILGLGTNGHVAFNEPGSPWDSRAHVARLSGATRAANAAAGWTPPPEALTLGIANLLEARRLLLLIAGAHKQAARAALHRGELDPRWPVTSLLAHPDLTVIELDETGGSP